MQVLTRKIALRAGMSINHDLYARDVSKLDDAEKRTRYLEQFPSRLDLAGGMYLAFDADVGSGLLLTPGLRADAYVSRGVAAVSCDPRVGTEHRHGLTVAEPRAVHLPDGCCGEGLRLHSANNWRGNCP